MKFRTAALLFIALATAASAQAGEYVCKVYCSGGSTTVVISASSSSDAARKIDPQPVADQICKEGGYGKASSSTMSSGQCTAK